MFGLGPNADSYIILTPLIDNDRQSSFTIPDVRRPLKRYQVYGRPIKWCRYVREQQEYIGCTIVVSLELAHLIPLQSAAATKRSGNVVAS